ncbi:hypothetical protein DEJ33_16225 [Curtobacterium sp. MCPF17_047]|uniref:putative immunity protein n=1 Tax=unclassified Curtobacterium TaxID=257496 RepID=UPI000DA87242|nr:MULTISPECIES: hypothetical protein [unclassified Curtobacterium]PZE54855.1 hypothetical protein DEJ24_15500 [Curtobacterium sp. MCPF17_001]PZF61660.1 hypothetical protein DEJ33_16225 [Curtobacterium sp. MCPF17_047]WIB13270.1 hypothetical protein DEJ36_05245 [Curtobacterium sp. MCPF17_052]
MASAQTLDLSDRRLAAAWAADCAERVLPLFERAVPEDARPRDGIARTRAFARGEIEASDMIRRRFETGRAASVVRDPAARAAAFAAGQASGVAHMGAHALGAAAYAVRAVGLGDPDSDELGWQIAHMHAGVRSALRRLPLLGTDSSGPLGSGLLASGGLAVTIRALQASILEAP